MIEQGRYLNIEQNYRKYHICKEDIIEDEEHFLLHCNGYQSKRSVLFSKMKCLTMYNNYNFQNILKLMLNSSSEFYLKLTSS